MGRKHIPQQENTFLSSLSKRTHFISQQENTFLSSLSKRTRFYHLQQREKTTGHCRAEICVCVCVFPLHSTVPERLASSTAARRARISALSSSISSLPIEKINEKKIKKVSALSSAISWLKSDKKKEGQKGK